MSIPGITGVAASIFVVIAQPARTHPPNSHRSRPVRTASIVATAAAVINRARIESVLLEWLTTMLIGISASAAAPTRPAVRPQVRRSPQYNSHTASAPASTSGRSSENLEKPKSFDETTWTHIENGGLSTDT